MVFLFCSDRFATQKRPLPVHIHRQTFVQEEAKHTHKYRKPSNEWFDRKRVFSISISDCFVLLVEQNENQASAQQVWWHAQTKRPIRIQTQRWRVRIRMQQQQNWTRKEVCSDKDNERKKKKRQFSNRATFLNLKLQRTGRDFSNTHSLSDRRICWAMTEDLIGNERNKNCDNLAKKAGQNVCLWAVCLFRRLWPEELIEARQNRSKSTWIWSDWQSGVFLGQLQGEWKAQESRQMSIRKQQPPDTNEQTESKTREEARTKKLVNQTTSRSGENSNIWKFFLLV